MSKQVPASQVLPGTLVPVARALYMGYLQRATVVVGQPAHTPNNITTSRTAPRSANTARPAPHKKIKAPLPSQAAASPQAQQASAWEIEATGWASLPQQTVQRFVDCNTGLLDEFALVFSVRAQFPLHYTVFQQTACHSASEGNAETLFALSKNLTDPNMYPSMLIALTKIRGNKHAYKPAAKPRTSLNATIKSMVKVAPNQLTQIVILNNVAFRISKSIDNVSCNKSL